MTAAKASRRAGGVLLLGLAAAPAVAWADPPEPPFGQPPPGLIAPEAAPPPVTGPVPRSPGTRPQFERKEFERKEAERKAPDKGAKPAPGTPDTADKGAPSGSGPEQRDKLLTELYARLATAPDEATASQIAAAVEQLWEHSGSATADLLMARATAATEGQRTDLALRLLNAAIELQPDYAEAWNRRAYLFFLEDDYKRALGDIRRVLALEPHHFKALEGLANILQQLGEKKAALEAYDSLLKVHPMAPGVKKARDDLKAEIEGQGI